MPNLPALVAQGMTVGYASADITAVQRELVQSLFEATGQFAWLDDEALMDPCPAVMGRGPGYVFAQYLEAAAVAAGIAPSLARQGAVQTLLGGVEHACSGRAQCQAAQTGCQQQKAAPLRPGLRCLRRKVVSLRYCQPLCAARYSGQLSSPEYKHRAWISRFYA